MIKQSLSTKLMLALSITMIVVAGLVLLVSNRILESHQTEKFEQDIAAQMELANSALMEAVFAYDFEQVETIAKAFTNTDLVTEIKIFDHRGKGLAASIEADSSDTSDKETRSGIEISREGKVIGRYDIIFSTKALDALLTQQTKFSSIIVFMLLLASLGTVFILTRKQVITPIRDISDSLNAIATGGGDLTRRLPTDSGDEVALLAHNFNRVMEQIASIIRNVIVVTNKVGDNVVVMSSASEGTTTSIDQQLKEIELIAAALQQMSHSADEVANHASSAASQTKETAEFAKEGGKIVASSRETINRLTGQIQETATKIDTLKESSENIGSVMVVIRSIAEQTNLLALNAAIEAARAGEQGRGFAVVADEVRSLAQKTQKSTEEIESIITQLQRSADEAHQAMNTSISSVEETIETSAKVEESLKHISNNINTINDMSHQIATASEEQRSVASEVSKSITAIHSMSENISSNTQIIAENNTLLKQESAELKSEMGSFHI